MDSWLRPNRLATPLAPAAPTQESFQSSRPASASNTASRENTCATRALPSRIPGCCNRMSRGPQPRVNARGDLGRVARQSVQEAPCPSSPDQSPACTLHKPSSPLARPRPAELQSPRFPECCKSPRAQKARPRPEEWCAAVADRSRMHSVEESYHPRFTFPTTLLPAIAWPRRLRKVGTRRTNASICLTLLRRGKNRLLRIKHNLPNAARRDQPKPSLRAIRQHFAQKNQPVSRRRRIHRNRRHQIIGHVLLYDHACNRGHPSLLRDANLPRFQLRYRRPFNPTFQKPIQLGTFLVPKWTRQFLFENLHQFTRAYGLACIPLPDFPQPAEEWLF